MNNAFLFLLFQVSVALGLATWANVPMLLVTLPTWVAFAACFAAQHHIR